MIALLIAVVSFGATIMLSVIVLTLVLYLVFYVGIPTVRRLHAKANIYRRTVRE